MAWFSNNEAILRRWAANSERPLPEDFRDFSDRYLTESMHIRQADPELVSILENTASAGLKADVLTNKFDHAPLTEEQQAEAARQAESQRLFDAKPFETGNLTDQMNLRALNPELAAQQEEIASRSQQPEMTAMLVRQMEAEQARARHESVLKGVSMAQGETQMRLRREQLIRQHRGDLNAGQVRK